MRRKRARQEEDADIDITPMLDIVFIMLIFFIVTATFVKESGIDVTRPDSETAIKQNRVAILIAIRDNNEIWINRRKVDLASVRANVEKLHAENPQGGAVIQADRQAETGVLVEIMDQVRRISKDERESGVLSNKELDWHLRDHSLFVGYAPHKNPRYAISIVIEHGGGGAYVAAPIARDIMAELLRNEGRVREARAS